MKLTTQQLARLSALVNDALDMPPQRRAAWLATLAARGADEPPVIDALKRMFSDTGTQSNFTLDLPKKAIANALIADANTLHRPKADVHPGDRLGPWRIERSLGEGGMGQVWLAARDDGRYDARAALKLIRGFASNGLQRRFEAEGRLLARLTHPNIARLLDAGERADGNAFLVLEYVEGVPVDRWADEKRLTVADRLKLFLQICAAVSYAHANLVVHRDIKPANILVQHDGQIKLLDFGVAKLLEADGVPDRAAEAGIALTPEYASPEQLEGQPISVASDVYSLGVLLFLLLAGVRPFEVSASIPRLTEASRTASTARTPRQLSTANLTQPDPAPTETATRQASAAPRAEPTHKPATPEQIAAQRSTTAHRLQRALRGDLDAILAKALEKLPRDRYATVQAFADDLQRHLQHQPVLARAGSVLYRARKFARRHWVSLAATAAVAVATAGGVGATLWQANQVKREAQRAEAIKDFLIDLYSANDTHIANDKPRGQMTARELMDVSADRTETAFAAYPETQYELLGYLAEIYGALSEDKRHDALREKQRFLIAKHFSPTSNQAIDWALNRVNRLCSTTEPVGCTEALNATDALITRAGRDQSVHRANWLRHHVTAMGDRVDTGPERVVAITRAITLLEAHAPQSRLLPRTVSDLGKVYSDNLEYAKAIEQYRRALKINDALPLPDSDDQITIYGNLALALSSLSQHDEAISVLHTAAALVTKTVGPRDPTSWHVQLQLATAYEQTGQREQSLNVFTALLKNLPDTTTTLVEADRVRSAYAQFLTSEGRSNEAIPILEDIARRYANNPKHAFLFRQAQWSLGWAYQAVGRFVDAKHALELTLKEGLANKPATAQFVLAVRESYGDLLFEMRDFDAAERQFAEVVKQAQDRKLSHIALAHGGLARVAAARGHADVALAESAQALDIWAHKTGFSTSHMEPRLQRMRADALAAAGRIEEAQKIEDDAWRTSQKLDGPANPTTQRRVMQRAAR